MEGKGEEDRGGTIHKGISHGRRSFHHQESVLDKKLREEASMEEENEREGGTKLKDKKRERS